MSAVLQRFREKLPHKPYCTNDFTYGVRILPKDIAILARFIQQNQPYAQYWLPFDVDRTGGINRLERPELSGPEHHPKKSP